MDTYVQANTNGRLHSAALPSISPVDRGFLYGDAIYEVWRTYNNTLFAFEEHWQRLLGSASALRMSLSFSQRELLFQIQRTGAAFREHSGSTGDLYVRLQTTRGSGAIGLSTGLAKEPLWSILVQDLSTKTGAESADGLRLSIARDLRRNSIHSLNPAWKTGNYLNNVLCLDEARARGADEVLILNESGAICESSVCNVFFVRGHTLVTPPLSAGILAGVTRSLILGKVGARAEIAVLEENVFPQDLGSFTECFLTSSTRDVIPVGSIDEFGYGTGPETVSQKLKTAFVDYAMDYALKHPELKV